MAEPAYRPTPTPLPQPLLWNGQKLRQTEFHARYELSPDVRAELINGEVHMSSPMRLRHGDLTARIATLALFYTERTPGTALGNGVTVIVDDQNEVEPDVHVRVLPECGGAASVDGADYVRGVPELLIEVADATEHKDLTTKRQLYARTGVREYLIVLAQRQSCRVFRLADGELSEGHLTARGQFRSRSFPGLWIDSAALFASDLTQLLATLELGLASAAHASFVRRLARQRQRLATAAARAAERAARTAGKKAAPKTVTKARRR